MLWMRRLWPLIRPVYRFVLVMVRGVSMGVRAVVLDAEGRVLLVEHTYVSGWHLPGGGVDPAEEAGDAVVREVREEAGVRLTEPPRLVSVSLNRSLRRDQVLLYLCGAWEPCQAARQGEILRTGWFAPDDLPMETTPRTRERIAEALG